MYQSRPLVINWNMYMAKILPVNFRPSEIDNYDSDQETVADGEDCSQNTAPFSLELEADKATSPDQLETLIEHDIPPPAKLRRVRTDTYVSIFDDTSLSDLFPNNNSPPPIEDTTTSDAPNNNTPLPVAAPPRSGVADNTSPHVTATLPGFIPPGDAERYAEGDDDLSDLLPTGRTAIEYRVALQREGEWTVRVERWRKNNHEAELAK